MENKNVTKLELVNAIYDELNCKVDKQDIQRVIDSFTDNIKMELQKGNTIQLRGFGTFEPRLRKGKKNARNPKTGETVSVDEHYIAAFRAGQQLYDEMWKLK